MAAITRLTQLSLENLQILFLLRYFQVSNYIYGLFLSVFSLYIIEVFAYDEENNMNIKMLKKKDMSPRRQEK